jgi:chemotaxis protein MotB
MKRSLGLIGLASMAMLVGCVPVEKYNACRIALRQAEEDLNGAQAKLMGEKARADSSEQQLAAMRAAGGDSMGMINTLQQQLGSKQAELDALNAKYLEAIELGKRAGAGNPLPAALSSELKNFAAQNPDLVEFDESRGMVKFKSDVTFDLGDASLKAPAKEAIDKFAKILNSPGASGYELLVAGHTDKAPVSSPATIAKGHKNNWYLSAHRAISVADELMGQKVSPARIGVVGYADQHPVSTTNDAANRRVEVLILPTQVHAPAPSSGGTAPKPAAKNDNKDSGGSTPAPSAPPVQRDNK